MMVAPGLRPDWANASTSSTVASSFNVRWMVSAPFTASAGLENALAPYCSSAVAFDAVLFHTLTLPPLLIIALTKLDPKSPMPKNAVMLNFFQRYGIFSPFDRLAEPKRCQLFAGG